jgi:hypothetical protein
MTLHRCHIVTSSCRAPFGGGASMQTIVLDDQGRAWDAKSSTLRSFLQCPAPDFDFLTYLIDNLGFVVVTKVDPRSARIRIRPETASQTSIAAALYLLADMGSERVVIAHSDDKFVERLCPNFSHAVDYIDELVAASRRPSSSVFKAQELSIDTLADGPELLSALLEQWVDSAQSYDATKLKNIFASALERFVVIEPVKGRLAFVDIGSGFAAYGKTWQANAAGMALEEQPDYDYGRWVHGMYHSVMKTRKPRLDDIDATIRRPHMNDSVHVRYRRLILPFTCGSNESVRLVGASVLKRMN